MRRGMWYLYCLGWVILGFGLAASAAYLNLNAFIVYGAGWLCGMVYLLIAQKMERNHDG
jgi:hypothetical protein